MVPSSGHIHYTNTLQHKKKHLEEKKKDPFYLSCKDTKRQWKSDLRAVEGEGASKLDQLLIQRPVWCFPKQLLNGRIYKIIIMFWKEELNLKFLPHLNHPLVHGGLCQASGDQRQIRFGFEELQRHFQIPGGQCSSVCWQTAPSRGAWPCSTRREYPCLEWNLAHTKRQICRF